MHLLDYLRIGNKDLRRQPLRSTLTIIALLISTVILITMAAISIGGRKAIINQLSPNSSLTNIEVTPNQNAGDLSIFGSVERVNQNATKLTDSVVSQIAKLPHVTSVVPKALIWEFNKFSVAGSNQQFVAQIYGIPGGNTVPLSAGSPFSASDDKPDVILGLAYAQELGYRHKPQTLIGKTITITTQKGYRGIGANIPGPTATAAENQAFSQSTTTLTATIVGVSKMGSDQSDLFVPLNWAREARTLQYWSFDPAKAATAPANPTPSEVGDLKTTDQIAENGYTSLTVTADTTADVQSVTTAISQMGFGAIATLQEINKLQKFSTTMWAILGAVAFIAIVAATLGVVNTMLMTVSEQRYIIGVWRACGARKSLIIKQFILEASILGFIGGILGTAIGLIVIRFINEHITALLRAQNISVSATKVALLPHWLIGGVIILTTLFGALAGLYPAYRAARQDPSETLRSTN